MTTAFLSPSAKFVAFANGGAPLVGGQLFTYSAGTSTPVATYTDNTGGTPNSNPVVLNSRGEANVWLLPNVGYKFTLEDAAGNIIWTVDQVFNSQLLTLFGGVDTGAANAYVLNFATPFTSYANGEVIYFIPSFTNSGPSTLNVNGLGPIPIVNINGTPLGAGQITFGQTTQVMYYNGNFQLLSIGSFTGVTIGTFGQETPIASAATTDLGTAAAHVVQITGTTTITSFGNSASITAPIYHVRFTGSLTLTYNATSLNLPGAASIITQPGDALLAQYLGNGNWKVNFYQSTTGSVSTSKVKPGDTVRISTSTLTPDPDLQTPTLTIGRYVYELYLLFDSVVAGAGFKFTNDGTAVDSRGQSPAVGLGFVNGVAYGPNGQSFYATVVPFAAISTTAYSNEAFFKGSLLVGSAGTFGVSWAQNTLTASNTTLRAGSYLLMTLVSTGTSSTTITRIYTTVGSFVETVPIGFNTLTLEVWGGSGGGGFQSGGTNGGGGGGSGAYCLSSYSVTGQGGNTLNFTVGAAGVAGGTNGGASSASSGTMAITTMNAPGGIVGGNASPGIGGTGGPGGSPATGGTVTNTNGNSGATPGGVIGGAGGLGIPGINDGGFNGGAGQGVAGVHNGFTGIVVFSYSV
jgi:hypothetical protein